MAIKAGQSLLHYRITEKIGEGGMGEVYRARDTKLSRDVAIKVLPPELARAPDRRARFQREASAVAALKHPNIVTVYSVEEHEGLHFITMELVEGRSLSDAIPAEGLPVERFLEIAIPLADALSSAHDKGVIHRDLKPANILLDGDGRVKVLDFGLAKLTEETDPGDAATVTSYRQTQAGQMLGTVAYMSPEQAEGLTVDPRSDIFSLGVVMYEMATGHQPFARKTLVSTLSAVLKEEPPPVVDRNSKLPAALDEIITRCIAKSPNDRFASAAELRDSLKEVQAVLISGQGAAAAPVPASAASTLRRPAVAIPLIALVLLLAGLVGWRVRHGQNVRWAREEALPAIEQILSDQAGDTGLANWEAFQLGRRAERYIPDDPVLSRLRRGYAQPLTVRTDPPGVRVWAKPYAGDDLPWDDLGTTPIESLPYVAGFLRLKLELDGYRTTEDVFWNRFFETGERGYVMQKQGELPEEMVWVSASAPTLLIGAAPAGLHLPGVEHLDGQQLGDFLIDRYEVSNREFKRFVDAGGYEEAKFWHEPFLDGDRELSWKEAMGRFLDRTDRAGPATWEVGTYPEGRGDDPVTGISWYEAAAYAAFAGKSLPTIYHWDHVALTWASGEIVPFSNLAGSQLLPVGSTRAMNRYGTYDLAGNVREWCANPGRRGGRGGRFILGGGWNDPPYAFNDAFAQSPWDRSETNGVRAIRYVETSEQNEVLTSEIELPFRDFLNEPDVSDETFELYLGQFRYDPTPLNATVEETREEESYIRERIVFDAAYGGERMMAYLFLPKGVEPPYATVVYFPGSGSIHTRSSEGLGPGRRTDFIPKSGRALLWPVYKSTYERGDGLVSDYPDETNNWKEHIVMWGKDLRRSIDYLETRQDIDTERLAYFGVSWGAAMGAIMMAIEPRFKAGVVLVAGLNFQKSLPEVDQVYYIRRVDIPVLMLNGKYDFFFPYETSQLPYLKLMKTSDEHKRLVIHETGHSFPRTDAARETLAWLSKYL